MIIDALMNGASHTATSENLSILPPNNIKNEPSSLDHWPSVEVSRVVILAVGTGIVTNSLYIAKIATV